jgi:hypothetical protein
VKNKRKIFSIAASSRQKRNKCMHKSLNQDALVPASDVESNCSHYSSSAFPFLLSDGSTDTENSGEEVEVTTNLGKEMSDQPGVGNNTNNRGDKTQPLEEIIAQLKNNQVQRKKKPNGEDDGQIQ